MYTIQRLTTCSTRVRKTKNSIARDLNKEERPLATLWPALKVCKRKGSTIHFGLPFTDHLVCRCAPITWVYRGVGWGGVVWGGVVWGGMLTFIASGKHCREYGEGVGCGGVTVHCQRQTLSMVRWRCRMGWGGVGCSRSLPVANTVDRTVKVWDGVAVRGNNWVYVTLGFGVTKFRSNLIFNYWRNPISRNNLILSILNIFRILNKSNIYIK